ncbi:MAG: tetratricopeptide repeat protein, partial [Kiloniellales bacterium]|nr:tetratricopeptide repeat protein [Kiloniellales bacterium]
MADIFREVNEELRRDRASELAKKYGPYVIGFAVAIVLGTVAYQVWKSWDLERRTERSRDFAAALELSAEGDTEAALAALAELGDPDGGYGALATFERARLLAEQGRRDEAL